MVWPATLIDKWDEARAAEDDQNKADSEFTIGLSAAFPGISCADDMPSFLRLGDAAIRNSATFFQPTRIPDFVLSDAGRRLEFESACDTGDTVNDRVVGHVRETGLRRGAVVILPHWNSPPGAYDSISRTLALLGVACVELELPYHGSRNGVGRPIADRFLSCNLGATVRAVKQSVQDTSSVLTWLSLRGYTHLGVIGLSLGSCIAGILAAHDPRLSATALFLTAGDFAKVVWTGRATRHLRLRLEQNLTLEELQLAWKLISTETFVDKIVRPNHNILIVRAMRDTVVVPSTTEKFISQLQSAGGSVSVQSYPCGHYTLGVLPYGATALVKLRYFLARSGFRTA